MQQVHGLFRKDQSFVSHNIAEGRYDIACARSPAITRSVQRSTTTVLPLRARLRVLCHHPKQAHRVPPVRAMHGVFQGLFQVAQVHPRGGAATRGSECAGSARYIPWHTACAVVWELSRGLSSCRCGVNQETQSSIADFPNSLLTNKARVGFEAKNC